MAYDSLTLSILVKELNIALLGAKINKISQPERDEIFLHTFGKGNNKLVISANATINRIHLTANNLASPVTAPNFCMLLRKHISNATITNIEQMPFERVVDFTLETKNDLGYFETKHLIFELTGKTSNIILTNSDYVIFDTLKHLPTDINTERILLNGAKYQFFPVRDKITINETEKIELLVTSSNIPLKSLLLDYLLGVSVSTINEIMYSIDENNHSQINAKRIIDSITNYKQNIENPKPNIVFCNGVPNEVYPFDYHSVKGEKRYFETLNNAHDQFFILKDNALRYQQKSKTVSNAVKNAISRTEKKIAIQAESLIDCQDYEKYKTMGDMILGNIYLLKPNATNLTAIDYSNEDCKEITIELDKNLSAQRNAQEYFKKYRKQKNTIEITKNIIEDNKKQLDYLRGVAQFIKFCDNDNDLNEINEELVNAGVIKEKSNRVKKLPQSKPLHYNIEGFDIFVGKNNVQNDFLTNKMAKSDDIWLHTQSIHSSHTIIISNNISIPDEVILLSAEITAFYSQAQQGTKIAVDYTPKKYLSKPKKAPLGFVVYDQYNTVIVNPNPHLEFVVNSQK